MDNSAPTGEADRPVVARRPGGPSPVAEVLPAGRVGAAVAAWQRRTDRGAGESIPPATEEGRHGGRPSSAGRAVARRGKRPRRLVYDEDREVLLAFVQDFAREFNDRAPLGSSVTRAHNLLRASGLSRDAFLDRLYQARAITKERSASVRARAGTDRDGLPTKNKMAYFFAVLEDLLGLAPDRGDQVASD